MSCDCCCATKPKEVPDQLFTHHKDRGCTDIVFLLLFVFFWVVSGIIFSNAHGAGGQPSKILRGNDWQGLTCGKSSGVEDKPLAAWPWPVLSDPLSTQIKVCVSNCAETYTHPDMVIPHNSKKVFFYCIPVPVRNGTGVNVQLSGDFQDANNEVAQAMADMITAWPIILLSSGAALILSFFYLKAAKHFIGCLIWFIVMVIAAAGALAAFVLINKAKQAEESELANRAKGMYGLGYFFAAATFVFICVIYYIRDRIDIAIEVAKESSRAVDDMKGLVFFPLGPFCVAVLYAVYWVAVSLYIFSVADFGESRYPEPFLLSADLKYADTNNVWRQRAIAHNGNFKNFKFKTMEYKYIFAFHCFSLLWNMEFIIFFTYTVIAGAIANWYFTKRTNGREGEKIRGYGVDELPLHPLLASFKRTLYFHVGTIAFASLVVAICEMLRATILYIAEKSKGEKPNCLQKCLMGTISCCLRCVTCCLEKVSKTGLVWTAIWGDSFIVSCCSSFKLVWENLSRVAAINIVSGFLMLLGKVLVALVCTGVGAFLINMFYDEEISSLVMPCIVIFVLCFVVATLFMMVFEVSVDCIFLCFLVDEKNFGGTDRMYASKSLEATVNKYKDASTARAEVLRRRAILATAKNQGHADANGGVSVGAQE